MKFKNLYFSVIIFYLISFNFVYSIDLPNIKNIKIHKEKKKISNLHFFNSQSKKVSLNDFSSNLVIINFWATWCAPCKKEMPSLDGLYQSDDFKNLQVFAVNMEEPNRLKTKKFFNNLKIKKLKIFFDSELNFVKEFKLRGVPTTVLINKKGEEFARIIGEVNFQDKKFIKWLSKYY